AAVLDPGRVRALPLLGRERDRDDGDAGGAPGPGSRTLLRPAGDGDRLRRLAGGRGRRLGRTGDGQSGSERGDSAGGDSRPGPRRVAGADLRLQGRAAGGDHHRPGADPGRDPTEARHHRRPLLAPGGGV
ncbi:MAG: 5'-methylthioadenosine phosphorylase, partial [uncultured Thermomicrobiales bacterium]